LSGSVESTDFLSPTSRARMVLFCLFCLVFDLMIAKLFIFYAFDSRLFALGFFSLGFGSLSESFVVGGN